MAKEIAKKSSKEALRNLSLEQFENRSNKLQISYKQAVLYENRLLKDRSQDFEVLKSLMISFIRGDMESEFFYGEFDGKGGDEVELLQQYRQQCLSVLGRLNNSNYAQVGIKTKKNGQTCFFYILQYLYKYCKTYQAKQDKKEKTAKKQ